jgi:hypothetical protein
MYTYPGEISMETCSFIDFFQTFKPWLDDDYIRKGYLDSKGNFRLFFTDGGEKAYRIDDCSESRLMEIYELMISKGIPVEKGE